MYLFLAHYTDMNSDQEITRKIEFNGQSLDSEKDCYLYAMGKAFDMTEEHEVFSSLEFIAC